MSDEQSIRDELAEDIQAYLVMSGVYLDHEVTRSLAECLLTEDGPSVIRRIQAEALAKAIQAHRDLHQVYASTAACHGGIGGMALTEHCAVVCDNPKHDAAKEAWNQVEIDYFNARGETA